MRSASDQPVIGPRWVDVSQDGLGTMCTEHWRAYVKGLREARMAAKASDEIAAG